MVLSCLGRKIGETRRVLAQASSRKRLDDFGDDLLVVLVGAIDGELGVLAIEALALVAEGANGLALLHDDAACVQVLDALLDPVHGLVAASLRVAIEPLV